MLRAVLAIFFITFLSAHSWAQKPAPQSKDSTTLIRTRDSIPLRKGRDSLQLSKPLEGYTISKDTLTAEVIYGSEDSSHLDVANRIFHLYGNAFVQYLNFKLEADHIAFNLETNVALAEGHPDSSGTLAGFPVFSDGKQSFEAIRMEYNFKSIKGLIYDVTTEQGDIQVHGTKTKFYGVKSDEGREDDIIYNHGAIFTTCNHPEPHFGIRSNKQKIVTDKVAVVGFSNLEVKGVPTPIVLPFGFFPLKQGQRAGFIFPRDYEYSNSWGFGLRNVGYYFPINDYIDAQVLGDIYFRGSWGLQGLVRYRKRYKYNGSVNLAYSRYIDEQSDGISKTITKSFRLRINHTQDAKAHPSMTIGGSINIQTNNYKELNYNDANNVLNNQLSSNFAFRSSLPGTPFRFSASLTHSQNTRTRQVNLSLPKLDIQMTRLFPFKRKRKIGPEKWYEKISLSYNSTLQNRVTAADTAIFTAETWDNSKFGVRHNIESDMTLRAFKFLNVNPFVRLKETWYTKRTEQMFVEDLVISRDTIYNSDSTSIEIISDTLSYGEVVSNRVSGFKAVHELVTGVSINTQIFGTIQFRKGWLRGLRHTFKPSFSLSYTPDYTDPSLGYYGTLETINDDGEVEETLYSKYASEIFGGPGSGGKAMALSYSFNNIFEGKFYNKRDSTEKKVKFFDNIRLGGSYNFAADSLNFSTLVIGGNTRLFKGITTLSIQAVYDFYAANSKGGRINTFYVKETGKLLRFVNASFRLSTGFTFKQARGWFTNKPDFGRDPKRRPPGLFEGGLLDIFDNVRISHNFTVSRRLVAGEQETDVIANSIGVRGRIPLTSNWNFNISSLDYNFITQAVTYPDLGISRDLHCWEFGLNWQAARGTYSFYIRVKPGSLDFIKVPYQKNRSDAFNSFN